MADFPQPLLNVLGQPYDTAGADVATGFQIAGTFENDVPATPSKDQDWTNIANAASFDDSFAGFNPDATSVNAFLRASNFGFSVPAGATMLGVEVLVGYNNLGPTCVQEELRLAWGSAAANTSTDNKFGGELIDDDEDHTIAVFGGPTDLWGENSSTITPAVVNSSDFGAIVKFDHDSGAGSAVNLDALQVRVYYSVTSDGDARVTQTYAEVIGSIAEATGGEGVIRSVIVVT